MAFTAKSSLLPLKSEVFKANETKTKYSTVKLIFMFNALLAHFNNIQFKNNRLTVFHTRTQTKTPLQTVEVE